MKAKEKFRSCYSCGAMLGRHDWRCPCCGSTNDGELLVDYRGRCGNCTSLLGEEDRYCRKCGTKRGEGKFAPYRNVMQCIYGPRPRVHKYVCTNCQLTWEVFAMVSDVRYCTQCGQKVTEIKSEDKY